MKKLLTAAITLLTASTSAEAHFLLLKPQNDIVNSREIRLTAKFTHPMEGSPNMPFRIDRSGAVINGRTLPIEWKEKKIAAAPGSKEKVPMYIGKLKIHRPGVYQIFVVPSAYFEPAEQKFIRQITKVYVEAFGLEEGWQKPIGLKAEIVPVTRPFGLWEGNTFVGRVLFNGKPAANIRVEVEYYNKEGIKPPNQALVTQVVQTDENGYFIYTIPWSGWWGFSAIGRGGKKRYRDGKLYPVELDAVLWIKAYPKPGGVK